MLISLLSGCASIVKPQNEPISRLSGDTGYYLFSKERSTGEHNVALSFSGGGTRAAALSYGVLQELRDTQIDSAHGRIRLLDEVDNISAVSGGSFTAAYYGLFGDGIFEDYERVFLRRGIQGILLRELLNPVYWWRSLFSGFDRTEMAIEYYDSSIFHGKTFADIPRQNRPFIEINTTDLNLGSRFSFTQGMFDLICSDLNGFSVARAVTASSAVPIAFPTVVLENHAGTCDIHESKGWDNALNGRDSQDPRHRAMRERFSSYLKASQRPYIHLVDGGLADNLGLRAILERIDLQGGIDVSVKMMSKVPKDFLIVLVNAEVKPERSIDQTPAKPSLTDTINAFSDIEISLYNVETRALLKQRLQEYENTLQAQGYPVRFYFAEVAFKSFSSESMKNFFNSLPTSLELNDQDIDKLIEAGRMLLREQPGYQAFLNANRAESGIQVNDRDAARQSLGNL